MTTQINNVVTSEKLYTGQAILSKAYSIKRVDGTVYEVIARVSVDGGWGFRSFGLFDGVDSIPVKYWNPC
jgi:hypothetical protein